MKILKVYNKIVFQFTDCSIVAHIITSKKILTSEISNINKNSIEKFEKIRQNKNIDKIILQTRRTK